MTKARTTALLWFVGGACLLLPGLLAEPMRPFAIFAGASFFAVGVMILMRDRGSSD